MKPHNQGSNTTEVKPANVNEENIIKPAEPIEKKPEENTELVKPTNEETPEGQEKNPEAEKLRKILENNSENAAELLAQLYTESEHNPDKKTTADQKPPLTPEEIAKFEKLLTVKEKEAEIKLEGTNKGKIIAGLKAWETYGQGEKGWKGFGKRMLKTAVNLSLITGISMGNTARPCKSSPTSKRRARGPRTTSSSASRSARVWNTPCRWSSAMPRRGPMPRPPSIR
jgi:hypothetical protein